MNLTSISQNRLRMPRKSRGIFNVYRSTVADRAFLVFFFFFKGITSKQQEKCMN